MNSTTPEFGAHELIVMNEALMTKAANAELLSHLAEQVQDGQLSSMLDQQARTAAYHYEEGVRRLQNHRQTSNITPAPPNQSRNSHASEPKLGLRQPSMPAPNMGTQQLSERSICTTVLNLHKHGAVGWITFALECADPDLRSYLVDGALMCDRAAYDTWSYMNQKGYYQVPTLMQKTTDTMIHAYQTSPGSTGGGYMPMTAMSSVDQVNQINPNESNYYNMH